MDAVPEVTLKVMGSPLLAVAVRVAELLIATGEEGGVKLIVLVART